MVGDLGFLTFPMDSWQVEFHLGHDSLSFICVMGSISSLKITKFRAISRFMFFDRYGIHIQVCVLFSNGNVALLILIFVKYFLRNIYSKYFSKNITLKRIMLNYRPENQEIIDLWVLCLSNNEIWIFLHQNIAKKPN